MLQGRWTVGRSFQERGGDLQVARKKPTSSMVTCATCSQPTGSSGLRDRGSAASPTPTLARRSVAVLGVLVTRRHDGEELVSRTGVVA